MITYSFFPAEDRTGKFFRITMNGEPEKLGVARFRDFKTKKAAENYCAKMHKRQQEELARWAAVGDGDPTLGQARLKAAYEAEEQAKKEAATRAAREQAEREFAIRDARAERAKTNALLKAHGYRWHNLTLDPAIEWDCELEDEVGVPTWRLQAPDGRWVSVEQARAEITQVPMQMETESPTATTTVVDGEQVQQALIKKHEEHDAEFWKQVSTLAGRCGTSDIWTATYGATEPVTLIAWDAQFTIQLSIAGEIYCCTLRDCHTGEVISHHCGYGRESTQLSYAFFAEDIWTRFFEIEQRVLATIKDRSAAREAETEDHGSSPVDDFGAHILTFGKYTGMALGAVPASYRKWLVQHARVLREENRKFALFAKVMIEK